MANNKPLYDLYQGLKSNGYDVPDNYDSFERTLTTGGKQGAAFAAESRHALYNVLKEDGYDVPEKYEHFYSTLFVPISTSESRAKPAYTGVQGAQPAQKAGGYKPAARPQQAATTQATATQAPAYGNSAAPGATNAAQPNNGQQPQQEAAYNGGTIATVKVESNLPKVEKEAYDYDKPLIEGAKNMKMDDVFFNGKWFNLGQQMGQGKSQAEKLATIRDYTWGKQMPQEQAYAYTLGVMNADKGQNTIEMLADVIGASPAVKQLASDISRKRGKFAGGEGKYIDYTAGNAIADLYQEAVAKKKKEASEYLNKAMAPAGASQVYTDMATMKAEAIENSVDLNKIFDNYVASHPEFNDELKATAIAAAANKYNGDLQKGMDDVNNSIMDVVKKRIMPQVNGGEYIASGVFDSILGTLHKMGVKAMQGDSSKGYNPSDLWQEAIDDYGNKHKVANIARTVLGMTADPVTWLSGGVGSIAGRGALNVAGRLLLKDAASKVAARYAAGTLAGRVAQSVAAGAANMGTYMTVKEAEQQLLNGGHINPETGKNEGFSASALLGATAHGLMLGAATGTVNPMLGNVADKAVKATRSTAGKVALRAGQSAVSTLAEGTIFAIPEMIDKGHWDWSTWTDSQAMMLGFKASHAIKSAPRRIEELRTDGKRHGLSFEERLRKQMDATPSDIGFKPEELKELSDKGYGDLSMLFRKPVNKNAGKSTALDTRYDPYENLTPKNQLDGYDEMKRLMSDNSVSEATRAKAYYILTGHMLPMSTVTGYTQERADDGSVVVNSTNANGDVVTTRRFANAEAARQEVDKIKRQAELNAVTMGEKYRETASDMAVVKHAIQEVAPGADFEAVMKAYGNVKAGKITSGTYFEMAKAIDGAIERNRHFADPSRPEAMREDIKQETEVDVDKALRKMPSKRTEKEQHAVEEYVKRLFPDKERKSAGDEGMSAGEEMRERIEQSAKEGRGAYEKADAQGDRSDADAIVSHMKEAREEIDRTFGDESEMRLAQLEDDPWEVALDKTLTEEQQDAVAYYINAKAALDGLNEAANDSAENKRAEVDHKIEQRTNKETGSIEPATLKVDDRKVYILSGTVIMYADGSGVDKSLSSQSIVVCDADTGEVRFVSPEMIKTVDQPISVDDERKAAYTAIDAEQKAVLGKNEGSGHAEEGSGQGDVEQPQYTQEGIDNAFNAGLAKRTSVQGKKLREAVKGETDRAQQMYEAQKQKQAEDEERQRQAREEEMATPLGRIPKDKDGNPMLEEADPETAWDGVVQYMDGNADDASEYVNGMVAQLSKDVERAKKAVSKVKPTADLAAFKQAKAAARQAQADAEARLAKWQQIANVNKTRQQAEQKRIAAERAKKDAQQHDEAVAQAQADYEARKQAEAERKAVGNESPMPAITEKWNNAEKIDGASDEIVLPNGERVKGHYVLHESGASSPSHDPTTWKMTDGFPMDANDNSVNDRDYENDKDAQQVTEEIAKSYDQRALQTPVVVSKDGVVLSGNGRTMAGELAARDNTDGAYVNYLKEYAHKFGFTPEQVEGMQHPRVSFVPDEAMPYTAETFAKFNQQEMKSQNKTEQAVKLGKTVSDEAFKRIVRTINGYDTLGAFYGDADASLGAVYDLHRSGVIPQAQLAEMVDGARGQERLSAVGREFLENMLIGKAFDNNPEAVRMLTAIPSMRQSVITALGEISDNIALGEDWSLQDALADAVKLCFEARTSGGFKFGDIVSVFARQGKLFAAPDELQTAADFHDATMMMLADVLNDSRVTMLKTTFALYNDEARESAAGQMDLFTGDVPSREDILRNVITTINNGNKKAIEAARAAAVERRKAEGAEQDGTAAAGGGAGGQGNAPAAEQGGRGDIEDTSGRQPRYLAQAGNGTGQRSGSEEVSRRSDAGIRQSGQAGGLNEQDADAFLSKMEDNAVEIPTLELNPANWLKEFGEDGVVATPIAEVKMGANQIAKLFEKGRSEQFGMIKPTLEHPLVIIEVPSNAIEGETERGTSWLFVKTFLGKNGEKIYYFKSVTVKKDGLEVSVSSHFDRPKRIKDALIKGKLLYRFDGGAQTEHRPADVSVTASPESVQGNKRGVWRTPKDAAASSAEKQGLDYEQPNEAEAATKGSGITPQSTPSAGKGSEKTTTEQTKSGKIAENEPRAAAVAEQTNGGQGVMPAGLEVRRSDLTKLTNMKGYAIGTPPSEIKVVGVDNIAEDAETGGVEADVTFEYPTAAGADGKKGTARVTKRVALVRRGQVPYKREQTKRGERKYYLDTVVKKDGERVTTTRVERDGKEIVSPNAYFPMPEGYEADPEYLGGSEGQVLGIHELRETKDGRKVATVVIKDENGVHTVEGVMLRPVQPKVEQPEQQAEPNEVQAAVAAAEAETNVEPTDAQKEAGNYKKGHVKIDGYDVTIENQKGSMRRGTDASGKQWEQEMQNTYGYIRGTEGVDGDHIDVFFSDDPSQGDVFVIDQVNEDGSFDEHKVMYGFPDVESARKAYLSNYKDGWQGLGAITPVSKEEFKKWIDSSHRKTKPFAEYSSVKPLGDTQVGEQPEQPKEIVPDVTQEGPAQPGAGAQGDNGGRGKTVGGGTGGHESKGAAYDAHGKPDVEGVKEKIAEIERLDKLLESLRGEGTEEEESIEGKHREATSELERLLMKMSLEQLEELGETKGEWKGTSLDNWWVRGVFSAVSDYKEGQARIQAELDERAEASRQIEPGKPQKKVAPMDFSYVDNGEERGTSNAVYHDGGFVVGTNGHIIYARREDYPAELEGKRTGKNGETTGGRLPKTWREILPTGEQTEPFEASIDGLHSFVAGVRKADRSKDALVAIKLPNGRVVMYNAKGLDLFLRAAKASNAEVRLTGDDAGYKRDGLWFHTDDAAGMIMPSIIAADRVYAYIDNTWVYDARGGGGGVLEDKGIDETVERASAEERLKVEALAEKLNGMGIATSTDWEQGQQVLDMANGALLSKDQKRALETVSPTLNGTDHQTAISSAAGAKVLNDLDTLIKDYENSTQTKEKTFLGNVADALGIPYEKFKDKSSRYATFETKNGKIITIRLSNHNATPEKLANNGQYDAISIVVTNKPNKGMAEDGTAHVVEYYYDAIKLRKAEGKPLAEIVRSIKQALYSGEFKDTTGLAVRQEVNIDGQHGSGVRFFRTADGKEAYGFTVGGRIYIDPRIATAATPVHEYAHLWSLALERANPEAWEHLKEQLMHDKELLELVRSKYPDIKGENELMHEVFAHYGGRRGKERIDAECEKEQARAGGVLNKARVVAAFERLRQLVTRFWTMARDLFAGDNARLKEKSADDFADMMVADLLGGFDPRKVKGKNDGGASEVNDTQQYRDKVYEQAVKSGDTEAALRMLEEKARENGYLPADYQGSDSWSAPMAEVEEKDFDNLEALQEALDDYGAEANIYGIINGVQGHEESYYFNPARAGFGGQAASETAQVLRRLRAEHAAPDTKIKVYRVVPNDVQGDSLMQGDWVALSRTYCEELGKNKYGEGRYRIIESDVPIKYLWQGSEDMREFGYDDGKKDVEKNVKNNRKLLEITYDEQGRLIPLSERFNPKSPDIRYQFAGEKGAAAADKAEEATWRLDNLGVARRMETAGKDAKAIKLATGWERGGDGKWRYEIPDFKAVDPYGNIEYLRRHPEYRRLFELNGKQNAEDFMGIAMSEADKAELEELARRLEVPTSGIFKDPYRLMLEDYVDAPELLKAYPQLRYLRVVVGDMKGQVKGTLGYYRNSPAWASTDPAIVISHDVMDAARHGNTWQLEEVLAHEVQHAIQQIEGFAPGVNPADVRRSVEAIIDKNSEAAENTRMKYRKWAFIKKAQVNLNTYERLIESGNPELVKRAVDCYWDAMDKLGNNEDSRLAYEFPEGMTAEEIAKSGYHVKEARAELERLAKQALDDIPEEGKKKLRLVDKLKQALEEKDDLGLYASAAGEVEARNASRRMRMSAEERRESLAAETEDVAREDQIFLEQGLGGYAAGMGDGGGTFGERQRKAVAGKGTVLPGLNDAEVAVVEVPRHDFTGTGKQAIDKAKAWAEQHIVGLHTAHRIDGNTYEYNIDNDAVGKFLSSSSTLNSDNLGVHLAVLKKLPEVIDNSIEAEEHPDYKKVSGERRAENGVGDNNLLVHRMYGAVKIDGKLYRVKTTMHEHLSKGNAPHDYRVTKIELLISGSSTSNALSNSNGSRGVNSGLEPRGLISAAKLLEGVEKSYDKGKKILAESAKADAVADGDDTRGYTTAEGEDNAVYRIREDAPPAKTGIGYKAFVLKDGKLYPPMVANPGGEATPVGMWLDADAAPVAGVTKTGRQQVKSGGKGTQGGSGRLAYRPGWHLGTIPYALQFNRVNPETGRRELFPANFVWAEVEYAADKDYQDEAMSYGMNPSGKFQHSLAGLPRVPENGSYMYRTNPDPRTDPWIITGAMKVKRVLTPSEVDDIVRKAGREPQPRQEGAVTDEQINKLNAEIEHSTEQDATLKRKEAEQLAAKLNTAVHVVEDVEEITHSNPEVQERRRRAKGWYDTKTGEVVVVLPNNRDAEDVAATVMHETVAHKGLRELVGEENYDEFLDQVHDHLTDELKKEVDERASRAFLHDVEDNGARAKSREEHQRRETDELLGRLAEKGFEDYDAGERTVWRRIKEAVRRVMDKFLGSLKLPSWFRLGDNELRYMLWRSKERLEQGREHPIDVARDVVKREELKLDDEAVYSFSRTRAEFDARQQKAVRDKGTVAPKLAQREVQIVHADNSTGKLHPFDTTTGATELKKQVKAYARSHAEEMLGDAMLNGHKVNVSLSSISEMADPKSMSNSVSKDLHLAALLKIKEIISNSVDVEVHPDYTEKNEQGIRMPGKYNPDVLIHRLYGAISIDGQTYRVKTTVKEIAGRDKDRAYTYEVTNIELLEDHKELSNSRTPRTTSNSISVAKLLEGVEKSYDKGKKILDESKKNSTDEENSNGEHATHLDAYDSSDEAKAARVQQISAQLNTPIKVISDPEEISSLPTRRKRQAKGWYDEANDEAVVMLPNNDNVADVENTAVHEVVGHKGLRSLIGKERFNEFLDEVHEHAGESVRKAIDKIEKKLMDNEVDRLTREKEAEADRPSNRKGVFARAEATVEAEKKRQHYRREATEEYMADMAGRIGEKGFEKMDQEQLSFWGRVKAKVQQFIDRFLQRLHIPKRVKLSDKDVAYILYKSWKNLRNAGKPSAVDMAEDAVMRSKTHYNEVDSEHFRDNDMGLDETITNMKAEISQANANDFKAKTEAMRAIGGNLSKLRSAMARQRKYDIGTAKAMTDLAKVLMDKGLLDKLSTYEVKRVLGAIKGGVGKEDISKHVQKLLDIMVDNQLHNGASTLGHLFALRGSKLNERGVEVQGELDEKGQRLVQVARKYTSLPKSELDENVIPDLLDRMGSDDKTIADNAAIEYEGAQIARRYVEEITESKAEERSLRDSIKEAKEEMNAGRMTKEEYQQYARATEEAIRQNKIERAEAYASIAQQLGGLLGESAQRAKEWREADTRRINEIHHNCNSDMEGRPCDEHHKETKVQKLANNDFIRFLLAPLGTFDQMLRMIGKKSVSGEGYLWNRFMRGWVDASDKEYTGYRDALKELDAKASEVFGKKMKWGDLYAVERKMDKVGVEFWDGGERKMHELTQGNLLYMYMVNKMADGQMKLRYMGVTDEDMEAITARIDPHFKELADWIQDEFLVEKRNKYNEVHKRMFGAPMAAIENYFPLKILQNSLDKEEDVAKDDNADIVLPGTTTSGIIKRKRNNKPLDITGADAIRVVCDHLQEMEHWAAFAELTRDINTMLSYKRFRNQIMNMTSAYGAGHVLWKNLRNTAKMAVGAYRPPIADLDKAAVNIAKGVTAAKVSFRVYTALKQLLSYPAYLPDASAKHLIANTINPAKAWKWSMENLPNFEKRWKSRMAGDPRLMQSEMDWKMWRSRIVEMASRIGMSPNAFVDALTVSIGARSMYQTRYAKYKKWGFDDETADKRARQDATILFNETQQSSEGPFLSTMQVDHSWFSTILSIFRNSSMSYSRQEYDAFRNEVKLFTPGYRERALEYMAKQLRRQGLTEEQADKAAHAELKKGPLHNLARILVFGFGLQLLWNLGPYLPYLLIGDDDDQKNDMLNDAVTHALFGSFEGLSGGDMYSNAGNMWLRGEGSWSYLVKDMPITSDLSDILKTYPQDHVEAINDCLNLLTQSAVGVNPQSVTDALVAILDYCGDDAATSRECALLIARIINCPPSQLDKIYFDELGVDGVAASKMTPSQIARRYARYKHMRQAPLTGWMYSEDELKDVEGKYADKANKKALETLDKMSDGNEHEELEKWREEYKQTAEKVKGINKLRGSDEDAADDALDKLESSPAYERYEIINDYKHDIGDLTKEWMKSRNAAERDRAAKAMAALKKELAVELKETNQQ